MAKATRSAHAELDELRQHAAAERVKARDPDTQLDAAKLNVERATAAVTEAYAAEAPSWWRSGARISRRPRPRCSTFSTASMPPGSASSGRNARPMRSLPKHARDPVDELEAEAREAAANLTRAGTEVVRAHRAYRTIRSEIDGLVAAVPGATSRADGPDPTYRGSASCASSSGSCGRHPRFRPRCRAGLASDHRREQDNANRIRAGAPPR